MALMLDNCEGILLSLDSHKSVPAPFLTKTYQLVDDPTTDHIVSWGEDDTTFVVWRPPEFARDLLPNYFKHNNFSSFVRQLNTYGFRKIVPDRWEFANEFFKKGEKHLLCEIHRRKTAQPQVALNHQHHHHHPITGQSFFPYPSRVSISPPDSDEQPNNWCDSPPPLPSPTGAVPPVANAASGGVCGGYNNAATPINGSSLLQKPLNQLIGYQQMAANPKQGNGFMSSFNINSSSSPSKTSQSSVTILEEPTNNEACRTKLFGVPLSSKKRLHPEYNSSTETNKTRLVLEKDDLGLNLMPPSPC
ncbi:UNVERIFIED_CONTAM: Heat stress transcription factor B-4 [Sesamum calycinum]|uniref:Heat stress transcription factor B-4 n=1 Tax=Sesamum calycinum TaxID=2727403 RepID=A0AAW2QM12_9LAMI